MFYLQKKKIKTTLQYVWFFNDDQTECVARERYTNSNAIFAHLANPGDFLEKILRVSDFSVEVYGDLSKELMEATIALKPKVYSFFQGL